MTLFRKDIEPRCAYCRFGIRLDENKVGCRHRGVMDAGYKCWRFRYDPLKRVPPAPVALRQEYQDADFIL